MAVKGAPSGLGIPEIERKAKLSRDRVYRYVLTRRWAYGSHATFIMLNPSKANAAIDDATIRRCIGFARTWKLGGFVVVNLYAIRSQDPAVIGQARADGLDPVGPENDDWIQRYLRQAAQGKMPVIAAWGANAEPERAEEVLGFKGMDRVMALGVNDNGSPRHPLYLPGVIRPRPLRELIKRGT
jgi:hypothetical protein